MPRSALVLPALAVAVVVASSSVVAGAAAAAATPHGRSAVNFHGTADHHVVAPTTTRPGIAHLRNTGDGLVFVAEAKHGVGDAHELAEDLKSKSPAPFLKSYRLVTEALPHSGEFTKLSRGTYYFIDIAEHIKAKKFGIMTVTGKRVDARTPKSRPLVVTSHHILRLPGSIAHSGYLHVENRSSALAGFLFVGVDTKATREMLAKVVAHPSLEKIFRLADTEHLDVLEPVSLTGPHSVQWVPYHGMAGRYLAAVLTVGKNGGGHLHHGQVRVLHLT